MTPASVPSRLRFMHIIINYSIKIPLSVAFGEECELSFDAYQEQNHRRTYINCNLLNSIKYYFVSVFLPRQINNYNRACQGINKRRDIMIFMHKFPYLLSISQRRGDFIVIAFVYEYDSG